MDYGPDYERMRRREGLVRGMEMLVMVVGVGEEVG